MVEDENILKTILEKPEDALPPDTFHFWSTMVWEDAGELARCQQTCLDEPNCYYYTYVSYQTYEDLIWDGTCTGASREHPYEVVVDSYAYSGIVDDCATIGKKNSLRRQWIITIVVISLNQITKSVFNRHRVAYSNKL